MFFYDERVDACERFVHHGWYASDGEFRRAPMSGLWATIVPLGRHVYDILIERDDEFRCKRVVHRKRRCESLQEAKEYSWDCFESHLEAAREQRFLPRTPH